MKQTKVWAECAPVVAVLGVVASFVLAAPSVSLAKNPAGDAGAQASAKPADGAKKQAPVITKPHLEEARQLMIAMGMKAYFENLMTMLSVRMAKAVSAAHPEHAKAIKDAFKAEAVAMRARGNDAISLIAPFYAEELSVDEMQQARAFYNSAVGKKLTNSQSAIAKRARALGAVWGGQVSREMQRNVFARLKKNGVDISAPAHGKEKANPGAAKK